MARFLISIAAACGAAMLFSTPASALIVCSRTDCWHAETRVTYSGIKVTYHPDGDLAKIRADRSLAWHPQDNIHNWLSGYWLFGYWYETTPTEQAGSS